MALEKQVVPVVIGDGGIDTGSDEKSLPIGKLLVCENASFKTDHSLTKRNGYTALTTSTTDSSTISGSRKLCTFDNELLQLTTGDAYSYSQDYSKWVNKGHVSGVSVQTKQIVSNYASQDGCVSGSLSNITVYAWEDSRGGIRASVIDELTGVPVQQDVQIAASSATAIAPKIIISATLIYIFFTDGTTLFVQTLDPATPTTFVAAATTVTNVIDNYDVFWDGTNLVLAYNKVGPLIATAYLKSNGVVGGVADGLPANAVTHAGGAGDSICVVSANNGNSNDAVYVFWTGTPQQLQAISYTKTLTVIASQALEAGVVVIKQMTAYISGSTAGVWYEVDTGTGVGNRRIKFAFMPRSGFGGVTDSEMLRSVGLASKIFLGPDSNLYFIATHESDLQPTFFTIRVLQYQSAGFTSSRIGLVTNSFAANTGGGLRTRKSNLPSVTAINSITYTLATVIRTKYGTQSGHVYGIKGVLGAQINFKTVDTFQTKQIGRNLFIAGGMLQMYDGQSVVEAGFNFFPEGVTAVNRATGSGAGLTGGTYQVCALYEWVDNQGQTHRSAPSVPVSVAANPNDYIDASVPALRLTQKTAFYGSPSPSSEVSIVLYMTVASGTVFYRYSSITSPRQNSITSDTLPVSPASTLTTDAELSQNEILYTTGGVLENIQPTSSTLIEEYNNRIFLAGNEDGNIVEYSKEYVAGESVQFSDALTFRADQWGKSITAIKKLDDKLIIFKNHRLLLQLGQGPTDAGTLDDFIVPQSIPSDVGCPYPSSLVEIPTGIVFKSQKGFYLLSRSLQTTKIGKDVESYNSLTVSSASLLEDTQEFRVAHSDGSTLVYDIQRAQWGTFTNSTAVSSCIWNGVYAFLKSDGVVMVENANHYLDNGAAISMRAKTGWIPMAGIQGFQRIYKILILGKLLSAHTLTVTLRYNYNDTSSEVFTFNSATTFSGAEPYQFEIKPSIQKCEAIQIEISDANAGLVDGAGFSLSNIAFEVGVKRGAFKLGATKRIAPT